MDERIILRFRDLVTEEGGTIDEHRAVIRSQGEVWWGWWMRQYETPPREVFASLVERISHDGPVQAYLCNTGEGRIFTCLVADVKVAPPGTTIGTPDAERSPLYYERGRYPAWLLLRAIDERAFDECNFTYKDFPSRPESQGKYSQLVGQRVPSLDDLRQSDVTIWVVTDSSKLRETGADAGGSK